MKTSPLTTVLLLTLGASIACANDGDRHNNSDDIRHMGDFAGLTNRTDAGIDLVEPDGDLEPGDIRIACDSSLIDDVKASVDSDGDLVLDFSSGASSVSDCTIHVVADGMTEVTNDGDGDISCSHHLFDFRTIEVNGNGDVHITALDATALSLYVTGNGALAIDDMSVVTTHIDLRGTGDITLAGTTVDADISISGNGNLWARDLTVSGTLDADLSGNGDAEITVLGTVNAEVTGNGALDIYGGAAEGVIVGEVTFH